MCRAGSFSDEGPLLDVDVIHKPAQVFDPSDLGLLFRTPAHVIITHLDLDRVPAQAVFPNQEVANCYPRHQCAGSVGRSDDHRHLGRRPSRNHRRVWSADGGSRGHSVGSRLLKSSIRPRQMTLAGPA